jgi:O-antigen/teichoic acid export membrane protein
LKALKKLTGQTAIYGVPSIVGRFLNWWLNPYWTYIFLDQAQMGRIINIYAYVAFMMVILTYGLETGYFRFATREKNSDKVFSTSIISLLFTSVSFLLLIHVFRGDLSLWLDLTMNPEFVSIMGITVVFDVISTIPFARLRLNNRPIKFAVLKFVNIGINIGLNVLFLSILPMLQQKYPGTFLGNLYNPNFGIGYVFVANLAASFVTLLLLLPDFKVKYSFDKALLKSMLLYSLPILLVGIFGMINQQIDKILLPLLLPQSVDPMKQLGIYGANYKMAVLLNMFIQAFRFAFEPFFFSQKADQESKDTYVVVMKYFVIIGLIMFLGLSTFVDVLKQLISPGYRDGIGIIPIVLMANFFMGVYFTQSLWYKVTDKTKYGAYLGFIGAIITVIINVMLIPIIGYYASALALLACFVFITVASYLLGRKYFPIAYDLKSFFFYLILSVLLFGIYWTVRSKDNPQYWLAVLVNLVFFVVIFFREKGELNKIIKS